MTPAWRQRLLAERVLSYMTLFDILLVLLVLACIGGGVAYEGARLILAVVIVLLVIGWFTGRGHW